MASTSKQEIKLFYCYAREDKPLRDELEKHLAWLKRRYQLTNWHDREILPGEEWEQAIDTHLNTAHLILLLLSPDFMASDYCYSKEMKHALKRHQAGTCRVVPILLRPTYWEDAPFSTLQFVPTDARAITRWPDRDEAFQDVVAEINRTIKDLLISLKTKEEWLNEGDALCGLKRYEEALAAYDQAIRLDPNDALTYRRKGNALYGLKRYEEALAAYEQAIHLDPNLAATYYNKGIALRNLKRYEEALTALEQAIHLDPSDAHAYDNKGSALHHLKRYQEALFAYEQAIHLDPDNVDAYYGKGFTLEALGKKQEAQQAYERARQFNNSS
jgi:tetratricopeptide (TPR) repeat protein